MLVPNPQVTVRPYIHTVGYALSSTVFGNDKVIG